MRLVSPPPPPPAAAAVRVSAFAAMSRLVTRMDQAEADAMLATAVKVGLLCNASGGEACRQGQAWRDNEAYSRPNSAYGSVGRGKAEGQQNGLRLSRWVCNA